LISNTGLIYSFKSTEAIKDVIALESMYIISEPKGVHVDHLVDMSIRLASLSKLDVAPTKGILDSLKNISEEPILKIQSKSTNTYFVSKFSNCNFTKPSEISVSLKHLLKLFAISGSLLAAVSRNKETGEETIELRDLQNIDHVVESLALPSGARANGLRFCNHRKLIVIVMFPANDHAQGDFFGTSSLMRLDILVYQLQKEDNAILSAINKLHLYVSNRFDFIDKKLDTHSARLEMLENTMK